MKIALLYTPNHPTSEAIKSFLASHPLTTALLCIDSLSWREPYDDLHTKQPPKELVSFAPDWIVCGWFPHILTHNTIHLATKGCVNIHNSYLPFARGKHPNFWSIIEGVPYGVSLHAITSSIDAGGVYAQWDLPVEWNDTGETLHKRSLDLAIELFKACWTDIANGDLKPTPQNLSHPLASFHNASEIEAASRVYLDKCYSARELLNLIRARQCYGHTAWFNDGAELWNVKVEITPRK